LHYNEAGPISPGKARYPPGIPYLIDGDYMDNKEYIKNVLVTESRDLTVLKERISADRAIRLLHGSIGLCTETAELFEMLEKETLDLVNLKEEIGDSLWYLAVIIHELQLSPDILTTDPMLSDAQKFYFANMKEEVSKKKALNQYIDETIKHVGLLQDLLKKSIFYGKPLSVEKIQAQLEFICQNVAVLCFIGGVTVQECMTANINKLRLRYGEKFTEQAAIDRNLTKERSCLEE
jgi:hypothetical protein